MRNAFDTENNVRSQNSRLGLTPQPVARTGERELLHIWAVRPPPPNRNFVHENAARFAPSGPMNSVGNDDPFRGMNRASLSREKKNRVAALLEKWGSSPDDAVPIGEGVSGIVVLAPVAVARRALVMTMFTPVNRLPGSGQVAIKFQLVRTGRALEDAILETEMQAIALTPGANGFNGLAQYVPKLYGAFYDPESRMYVTVMEALEGETLDAIVRRDGSLTPEEYTQLANAFYALWRRGLFHADAHGGNIFFTSGSLNRPPGVKIIDFGQSVFLPPGLRPRSFDEAMDPAFQRRLETYVASLKSGQNWFNPNTRALKIARSMVRTRTANVNLYRSNVTASNRSNSATVASRQRPWNNSAAAFAPRSRARPLPPQQPRRPSNSAASRQRPWNSSAMPTRQGRPPNNSNNKTRQRRPNATTPRRARPAAAARQPPPPLLPPPSNARRPATRRTPPPSRPLPPPPPTVIVLPPPPPTPAPPPAPTPKPKPKPAPPPPPKPAPPPPPPPPKPKPKPKPKPAPPPPKPKPKPKPKAAPPGPARPNVVESMNNVLAFRDGNGRSYVINTNTSRTLPPGGFRPPPRQRNGNNRGAAPPPRRPAVRRQMVRKVTLQYQGLLNKFLGKSKPVVFIHSG